MSEQITNYLFSSEDEATIEKVRFTERFCGCSGKCYPDTLEVEDYKPDEYLRMDIDSPDIAYFIKELLDKSCEKVGS
jgi:hypothetical protein